MCAGGETGTDAGSGTGAGDDTCGSETGTDAGADTGAGTGADTCAGMGADTCAGTGADTCDGTGADTGVDACDGMGGETGADALPAPTPTHLPHQHSEKRGVSKCSHYLKCSVPEMRLAWCMGS